MRILLVGHGAMPIPPKNWGAIEGTIWSHQQYLQRLGHTVDIANTRAIHEVISKANQRQYDFVHTHNELFVLECLAHLRCPFAVTSHQGGLHIFDPEGLEPYPGFGYLFEDTLRAPVNIVLSEHIGETYRRSGYGGLLRVLRNGIEVEQFRWAPAGNGRVACVGLISLRKRQAWLAKVTRGRVPVDFIGPYHRPASPDFAENETARYLGVWDRSTLYERLTDYSCLALLSASEAAPKVVLEALAAGLSLVVSEACTANLTHEPFITVIPDGEERPEVISGAIEAAIAANGAHRADIRRYAEQRFDYSVVMPEYVEIVQEAREYCLGGGFAAWSPQAGAMAAHPA